MSPELYGELFIALVFALLAPALLNGLKAIRRVPRHVIGRVRALDLSNPIVMFMLQVIAVVIALVLLQIVGL
ncbi:hypothetical protein [Streptomyces sp. NPDC096032]|uniref:hypothetical protein n=1 Tax=Streptomyces sp. NPDC096032 TaxID=3366070 RepID=UPI00380E4BF9